MADPRYAETRQDALAACAAQPEVRAALARQHLAVTGGTGFLGTWIAELVAALNDEYGLGITLALYARNVAEWRQKCPHLAARADIRLHSQDVRSSFEFARNTSYVIHAAGIPNNRVHASDPQRAGGGLPARRPAPLRQRQLLPGGRHAAGRRPAGRERQLPAALGPFAPRLRRGQARRRDDGVDLPQPVPAAGVDRAALHADRRLPGTGPALGHQ